MPHCSAPTRRRTPRHVATFLFLALTVAVGAGPVPRLPATNARPLAIQRILRPTLARPRAASLLHSLYLPLVMTPPSSLELIDAALKRGEITAEAALIYNVYAVFTDRRLPTKYQGDDSQLFDPGVLRQAAGQFASLSPAAQATLQPFLTPPTYVGSWNDPARPMQGQASPTGEGPRVPPGTIPAAVPSCNNGTLPGWNQIVSTHAIIWYQTAGDPIPGLGGSYATPAQTAAAANNLAASVENIWTKETGLFQRPPLSDGAEPCNGGNGKFDIYVTRESLGARAQTVLYPPGGSYRPAYIWVAPDSASTAQNARDVLAHEFFHAISAAYKLARGPHEYDWLDEATANEMIDYVYPTDQYEQYYATSYMTLDHLVPIEASAYFGTNGYDDYVFLFFLARNYSPQLLKAIWNATEQGDSLQAIETGTQVEGGWATVWPVFANLTWNDWDALVQDNYWQWDQLERGVAQFTEPDPVSLQGQQTGWYPLENGGIADHLSIHYTRFTFADDTVRSVYFDNKIYNQPNANVQALIEINDHWHVEDWTGQQSTQFCRDQANERLQELVIIVSNTAWQDRNYQIGYYNAGNPRLYVSNVGCWKWNGTATGTYVSKGFWTLTATANVSFAYDPQSAGPFLPRRYLPSGTMTWQLAGSDSGCTYSGGPTTVPIMPLGDLEVETYAYSNAPYTPNYFGDVGYTNTFTYTACGSTVSWIGGTWFSTNNEPFQVSSDGLTMDGTVVAEDNSQASQTYTWHLVAQREP